MIKIGQFYQVSKKILYLCMVYHNNFGQQMVTFINIEWGRYWLKPFSVKNTNDIQIKEIEVAIQNINRSMPPAFIFERDFKLIDVNTKRHLPDIFINPQIFVEPNSPEKWKLER